MGGLRAKQSFFNCRPRVPQSRRKRTEKNPSRGRTETEREGKKNRVVDELTGGFVLTVFPAFRGPVPKKRSRSPTKKKAKKNPGTKKKKKEKIMNVESLAEVA